MTTDRSEGAAPSGPAPAPRPEPSVDDQIMAIWRALRANYVLDASCAMDAIDRLLDQRTRPADAAPPRPSRAPAPGSSAQHAVLPSILGALLTSDPS